METLFIKILNMSITAGYVILALLLIRLLLKKVPKKYSYLLWSVALFRLICPVSFSSLFSIFQMKPFDMTMAQNGNKSALTYIPADIGMTSSPRVTVGIPSMNTVISERLPAAAPSASVNPLQLWILVGAILWCAGIAAILTYNIITFIRLRHRMDTAVRLEGDVFESDRTRSPFILGFFRPRIYIPFGLREQERTYILQHERVHLKRKDPLIKLLSLFVLAIHWFNPLVWIAHFLMVKDMEMSCDEKVLSQSDSSIAREYSLSLLSFAANRRFPAASPLAFGEIGIRERVKNILRFKKPSKWMMILVTILCAVAVLACVANPKLSEVVKEEDSLYGNYAFEHQIYMNPFSSFLVFDGYQEYYTLDENSLIVTGINGGQQKHSIAYKKTALDKETFYDEFMMENVSVPDIASYQECYQLISDSGTPGYRLYQMDDELWLARVNINNFASTRKSDYIWSIYKIKKFDGEFPVKTFIYGQTDGVEDFLSLQEDFAPGYDSDTCYNITPDNIRQESDYRIFKYDVSCASFLQYKGEIYPLGEWFGGLGVTSMALADVNSDGLKELYFTYSWGSGLHRSHAAYFDPASKQTITLDYTHLNKDMLIAANNRNGGLSLYSATISNLKTFTSFDIEKTDFIADIVYQNNKVSLNQTPGE